MADAGLRLTVEGEKEFKAALAEIDAAVKSNQKAMKSLTEEFKLNETGMKAAADGIGAAAGESTKAFGSIADAAEILRTKSKVLADSIEMQTEKFQLLDVRVEEARKTYGEYDKRTIELKNQLLDASTALTKLNNEYEKNQQALLDAEHSTKEYDDAVKALEAQLAANQAELKNMGGGLDALKKEYGDLGKSTSGMGRIFGDLSTKVENLRKQNDNLTRQNDKLSDSVKKQRDLVDNLARAQEIATARYGEGSVKAEEYRKKLADATGQLDKMERELQENQKAIEGNNKAIANGGEAPFAMLDGLKKIEEMTGIKIPAGIEKMVGAIDGGSLAAAGAIGGIVTALVAVAKKEEELRRETEQWADDISTRAAELGTGTTKLQEIEHVANEVGFDVEDIYAALVKIVPAAGEGMLETKRSISEMTDKQVEAGEAADEAREKYNEASKAAAEAYDKYAEASQAALEAQQNWEKASKDMRSVARGSEDYEKIAERLQPWLDKYDEAVKLRDEAKKAYDKEQESLKKLEAEYGEATAEVDRIADTIQALNDKQNDAVKYWDSFGIALTDASGKARDSVDVLMDVLQYYEDEYDDVYMRVAAMKEIFGKNTASAMEGLIEAGIPKIRELMEEAHKFNNVVGEEYIDAADKAGKANKRFEEHQEAIEKRYVTQRIAQENFFEDLLLYLDEAGEKWDDFLRKLNEGTDYEPSQNKEWYHRLIGWSGTLPGTIAEVWHGLKDLFGFASGTNYAPGGMALVGEQGPEIVELPRGSKVYPNGTAPELAGGSVVNESNVYNITIDAASVEEFNDIVRIAQGARVGMRRG